MLDAARFLQGNQRHLGLVRSNVYLRNLDPSCTDEELRELFQASSSANPLLFLVPQQLREGLQESWSFHQSG